MPMKALMILCVCFGCAFLFCSSETFEVRDDTVLTTAQDVSGTAVTVSFRRGPQWFHEQRIFGFSVTITPQIAVWVEDTAGAYVQTLFVTHRFARQDWVFAKYDSTDCIRTMSVPYWFNKYRGAGNPAPTQAQPMPDGVTGATPTGSFQLNTTIAGDTGIVMLLVELNKSFDPNETFTKDREESKFNGQPPVIYAARIDLSAPEATYSLAPYGRSGESGDDPALYQDLDKITTAWEMIDSITVSVQ